MVKMNNIINTLKNRVAKHNVTLLIIIPTYNEIGNINRLIQKLIDNVTISFDLLIIDDNSPDGTSQLIKDMQNDINNLHLVIRKEKAGLGSAYIEGFNIAIKAGYQYCISMDADLSHPPEIINLMLDEIKNHDLIIGSRYVNGGGYINLELWRIIMSMAGNSFARIMLNLKSKDCTAGFRCMRTSILSTIIKNKKFSKRYVFLVELLFFFQQNNCKIKEVPITFTNRTIGQTKINFTEMIQGVLKIIQLGIKSKLSRNYQ